MGEKIVIISVNMINCVREWYVYGWCSRV